jgi:hypothetical protein
MSVYGQITNYNKQAADNLKNWKFDSYNTAGISGGIWCGGKVGIGGEGGLLTVRDQHMSRYYYALGDMNVNAGVSSSPIDIDVSLGMLGLSGPGGGQIVSATGLWPLTKSSFAGSFVVLSASGGIGANYGMNLLALGCHGLLSLTSLMLAGPAMIPTIVAASKVVIVEHSVGTTWTGFNVSVALGVGHAVYGGQTVYHTPVIVPANPARGPVEMKRIHIVQPGDSLSKLSMRYYGDYKHYTVIHNENRDLIGDNPNYIEVDWPLVIPPASLVK